MVGCVIVNYRSPWEMLERCLRSVLSQAESGVACNMVLVDNASGDGVIEQVHEEFPEVRIIEMSGNPGFAAAVNRGLDEVEEPLVLMLNTDAVLMEGALARMVAALDKAGEDVAGIAPKMMSSSHEGIIDAIGIVLPPSGAAFNRGIGQCDLGQYDEQEEVAGVCFGAGLLRRELFQPGRVGPLYEGYFLYFEDSDWCMRADSQGYRFLTAPDSVVLHMHSGVTRNESLDLKYGLIELNTLKMVTRNFESGLRVAHIISARCLRLLARTFIRRKFIGPNLRTISSYLGGLRGLLEERRELRSKRVVSDSKIFAMAEGENAYFDTVAYEPDRCIDSLIDTYLRLLKKGQDPELGKLLAALYQLSRETVDEQKPGGPAADRQITAGRGLKLDDKTRELFAGQPPCVQKLLGSGLEL